MIYLFTALYCEAEGIIEHYGLRKNRDVHKFQVFENENMRLAITGSGAISAAVAVAYICAKYNPTDLDFIVNVGICGGAEDSVGKIFLCNKIEEASTGRSYYPDILFRHGFQEKTIVTVEKVMEEIKEDILVDMEAAGIYQAALHFVYAHQVSFLKLVSDSGAGKEFTAGTMVGLMRGNSEKIREYMDCLMKQSQDGVSIRQEQTDIGQLLEDLHCSQAMGNYLKQLVHYCRLTGVDYERPIREMHESGKLPCKSKREGKLYLEELRQQLL